MKYALSLLLLCLSLVCSAQNDSKDVDFINQIVNIKNRNSICYYVNKPSILNDQTISELIKRDTIKFKNQFTGKNDVIVFSQSEKDSITRFFKNKNYPFWLDGLLPNSKQISADTIKAIFDKDDVNKGWTYFYRTYSKYGYFAFSKPLFLRNNSLCIFYNIEACGYLCADGKASVYLKIDNKWVEVYRFFRWQS